MTMLSSEITRRMALRRDPLGGARSQKRATCAGSGVRA